MTLENIMWFIGGILAGNLAAIALGCLFGYCQNRKKPKAERRAYYAKPIFPPKRWD